MDVDEAPTWTELVELKERQLRMQQIKDLALEALEGVKTPTDAVGTLKKILSLLP